MTPIRQLRHRLQVTTRELAELLGCDIRQVQRWERTDQRPPISAVRLLHLAATVPEARAELERLAALHSPVQQSEPPSAPQPPGEPRTGL